jgi:hypothetical protein
MLPNTPKLGLPQWEPSDDFDVNEVNAALLRVENKLCPPSYTTALRPTGTERYDGMIIYDTDLQKYLRYIPSQPGNGWRSVDVGGIDIPTITFTPAANFSFPGSKYLVIKNCVAQLYITVTSVNAIAAGDIGNTSLGSMNESLYYPRFSAPLMGASTGPSVTAFIGLDGSLTLCSVGTAIAAGGWVLIDVMK